MSSELLARLAHRRRRSLLLLAAALLLLQPAAAGNPIVSGSMADPHVRIFGDRAYLYSGWDALPNSGFRMPSWRVFASDDLVTWTLEVTITPSMTGFMAPNATTCWATDAAFAAGRYHFFYSNHNIDIGVLTAPTPTGPWRNETAAPLFPANLTGYPQYDPTILTDDDGFHYMMFGLNDATHHYFLARLLDDLSGLAEPPRKVEWAGATAPGDDKSTLHKWRGTYYLTSGAYVSTASSVYGPWTYRGTSSDGRFGLTGQAHGNFFTWHGQWFHAWCYFVTSLPTKWRQSSITYAHYADDGRLLDDEAFLDAHNATGVGQYDAAWSSIEAEWFMSAGGNATTREHGPGGWVVVLQQPGDWLGYPHVAGVPAAAVVVLDVVAAVGAGAVELRAGSADGALLATCAVAAGASGANACAPMAAWPGGALDLVLVWTAETPLSLNGWAVAAAGLVAATAVTTQAPHDWPLAQAPRFVSLLATNATGVVANVSAVPFVESGAMTAWQATLLACATSPVALLGLQWKVYSGQVSGVFVTEIDGQAGDATHYWALSINGQGASAGADAVVVNAGDHIGWALVAGSRRLEAPRQHDTTAAR